MGTGKEPKKELPAKIRGCFLPGGTGRDVVVKWAVCEAVTSTYRIISLDPGSSCLP